MEGLASISMNVLLTLTVVAKAVPTLLGLSFVPVIVDSHSRVMEGLASISTNVLLTLMAVPKAVRILLGLSLVPVTVDSLSRVMEGLVLKTTSALMEHTTVSRFVSTLRVDSHASVSQGINSTLIKQLALVRKLFTSTYLNCTT